MGLGVQSLGGENPTKLQGYRGLQQGLQQRSMVSFPRNGYGTVLIFKIGELVASYNRIRRGSNTRWNHLVYGLSEEEGQEVLKGA